MRCVRALDMSAIRLSSLIAAHLRSPKSTNFTMKICYALADVGDDSHWI